MAFSRGDVQEEDLYERPSASASNEWSEEARTVIGDGSDSDSERSQVIENHELRRIATVVSRRSGLHAGDRPVLDDLLDFDSKDSALDPQSKDFDPSRWAANLVQQTESIGVRPARTGIMIKNLTVTGTGDAVQLQPTMGATMTAPLRPGEILSLGKKTPKRILNQFNGLLRSGELVIVLGRPGSGCTTMLKTMTGELTGLNLDKSSVVSYDGISQEQIIKEFKGEVVYNQEVDRHFPHLTVGQTLEFAAAARTPSSRINGLSRKEFASLMTQVIMAICGLSHTYNTKVGDDFIRGVSGGERKRVSIAEMMLAGSPFAAWDNRFVFFLLQSAAMY